MDYKNLTAPCGTPCFECNAYKAMSNEPLRKQISERLGMDYDKSACGGCRNKNGRAYLSEKNNLITEGKCMLFSADDGKCRIYHCAEKKGIHNCSECNNFPCELLRPLADKAGKIPHNLKVYNLCLIKKLGIEKWANENAAKIMADYMTKKFGS